MKLRGVKPRRGGGEEEEKEHWDIDNENPHTGWWEKDDTWAL